MFFFREFAGHIPEYASGDHADADQHQDAWPPPTVQCQESEADQPDSAMEGMPGAAISWSVVMMSVHGKGSFFNKPYW